MLSIQTDSSAEGNQTPDVCAVSIPDLVTPRMPRSTLKHHKSLQVLYSRGSGFLFRQSGGESFAKRFALLACCLLFSVTTSGVIFGFPALYDTLLNKEKAFSDLCAPGDELPCSAQQDRLLLTVTIATAGVSAFAFPAGMLLDTIGPRAMTCLSSLLFATGLAALAVASDFSHHLYTFGFLALAVGGPAIYTSMTNFAELAGRLAPAFISLQSGCFQLSSILMVAVQAAVTHRGFSFRGVLLLYMICPATIFLGSWFLFPDQTYGTDEGPGNRGEPHRVWLIRLIHEAQRGEESSGSRTSADSLPSTPRSVFDSLRMPLLAPDSSAPQPPELYNVPFRHQHRSLPFLGITAILAFFILRINFCVATVSDQVLQEALGGGMSATAAQAVAAQYTSLFTLLMPLVGAAFIPLVAFTLVRLGVAPAFAGMGVLDLLFSLATLPHLLPLQWRVVGYVALGCVRPLVYSAFANFVADVFGFANFGKLYGLAQLGVMLVAPLEYGLAAGTKAYGGGQYLVADLVLMGLGLLVIPAFTAYLTTVIMSGFFIRPSLPPTRKPAQVVGGEGM